MPAHACGIVSLGAGPGLSGRDVGDYFCRRSLEWRLATVVSGGSVDRGLLDLFQSRIGCRLV